MLVIVLFSGFIFREVNHLKRMAVAYTMYLVNNFTLLCHLYIIFGETMMGTLDCSGYESESFERCKIDTLDSYLITSGITPPTLIKVDIERAEVQFLKGALSTIEKFKPTLIIEFHNIELLRQGYQLLDNLNYALIAENGIVDGAYLNNLTSFYGNILATARA